MPLAFKFKSANYHFAVDILEAVRTGRSSEFAVTGRISIFLGLGTFKKVVSGRFLDYAFTVSVNLPFLMLSLVFFELPTLPLQIFIVLVGMENEFLHKVIVILKTKHTLIQFLALPFQHFMFLHQFLMLCGQKVVIIP